MTPFITLCSYVSMMSLAIMIFLIFLLRMRRAQGKDYSAVGFLMLVCLGLFLLGVILIGIFYKPV